MGVQKGLQKGLQKGSRRGQSPKGSPVGGQDWRGPCFVSTQIELVFSRRENRGSKWGSRRGSRRGPDGVQKGVQIGGSTFCTDPSVGASGISAKAEIRDYILSRNCSGVIRLYA